MASGQPGKNAQRLPRPSFTIRPGYPCCAMSWSLSVPTGGQRIEQVQLRGEPFRPERGEEHGDSRKDVGGARAGEGMPAPRVDKPAARGRGDGDAIVTVPFRCRRHRRRRPSRGGPRSTGRRTALPRPRMLLDGAHRPTPRLTSRSEEHGGATCARSVQRSTGRIPPSTPHRHGFHPSRCTRFESKKVRPRRHGPKDLFQGGQRPHHACSWAQWPMEQAPSSVKTGFSGRGAGRRGRGGTHERGCRTGHR